MIMILKRIGMKKESLMKIKVIRNCKSCIYHYWKDLEDDQCYEKGGCLQFSPIGLRLEDVEVILEIMSDKPKHSLEIIYDI